MRLVPSGDKSVPSSRQELDKNPAREAGNQDGQSDTVAKGATDLYLLPRMANRHGYRWGYWNRQDCNSAPWLKASAASASRCYVRCEGDLAGLCRPGGEDPKVAQRITQLGLKDFNFTGFPVTFWDVFGEQGHPMRATISEMGPLLLGRVLNLNDTQEGVLALAFKVADDNGLLLLDLKDLRAMLTALGDHSSALRTQYGNVSTASVGSIKGDCSSSTNRAAASSRGAGSDAR